MTWQQLAVDGNPETSQAQGRTCDSNIQEIGIFFPHICRLATRPDKTIQGAELGFRVISSASS